MTRIAILGATGYTAVEVIKILLRHPEAEIVAVTSRQEGNPPIATIHPSLTDRLDLALENLTPAEVAARAEFAFSCLPHGASASFVAPLVDAGCKVVDFSADYRLNSVAVYEEWYNQKHPDPDRVGKTVYGLPELFREEIVVSKLVANPGCYPTSAILALAPLLKAGLIEPRDIIIDSKSGVSGAGRTLKLTSHFPECNESVSAYNIGRHRHMPEIEQILGIAAGKPVETIFTPHLIPMDRGILSTTYSKPVRELTEESLLQTLRDFYADEPFVRVVDHMPGTKDSVDSNYCDITARIVRGRVLTVSCIDNLVKGASGAAVQNFNLMCGFPETTALR
jgi:N-acetyl-gamma-glutamyl-phosphate reductase